MSIASSLPSNIEIQIIKLEPKRGDILVFKVLHALNIDQINSLRGVINRILPDGVRAILMDPLCEIEIRRDSI